MEKLVRDFIPKIIRMKGDEPIIRIATISEYPALLRDKLIEEVDEYLENHEAEELADILETVYELALLDNISMIALENMRIEKRMRNGGFSKRIVWQGNYE